MIKSTFEMEKKFLSEGYNFMIGVDEAGRGPLAGPVVAVATTVRNFQFIISNFKTISNDRIYNDQNFDKKIKLIRDSKTLSEKQREDMFDFIHEHFYIGVGICDHKTIDRINILEASFLAMKKAINDLTHNVERITQNKKNASRSTFYATRSIILVDGNKKIPNFSMEQRAIVSGDKIVKSISAASIIAKVTRDRIMREMDKKYPEYQFAKHKGYGTKLHMEMLEKHRPCEIHRQTFAPVGKLLKKEKILAKSQV
jgi:ribonuclease HII